MLWEMIACEHSDLKAYYQLENEQEGLNDCIPPPHPWPMIFVGLFSVPLRHIRKLKGGHDAATSQLNCFVKEKKIHILYPMLTYCQHCHGNKIFKKELTEI